MDLHISSLSSFLPSWSCMGAYQQHLMPLFTQPQQFCQSGWSCCSNNTESQQCSAEA